MSMKVLIVDHDWRFANQAASYLESHAHLVVHHTRVKEAMVQAEHWKPDLVILAAEMADELLPALQAATPRPAILLTGQMGRFDKAWKAWQRGGDELLMKPVFKAAELHQAIVTAMENAATGRRGQHFAATA
jgi:DNA-binding response OmpR family regulator